jgi:hypothetical protein
MHLLKVKQYGNRANSIFSFPFDGHYELQELVK